MPNLSSFVKCLYCLWPAAVAFVCWWFSKGIDHKTYFGALSVGIDPLSPQGQTEFETRRQRDAEKRRIIYWAVGIIIGGYALWFAYNTFTVGVKAASLPTPFPTSETTATETLTPDPSPTIAAETPTLSTATATVTTTYAPTATDRLVYLIHTQIVEREIEITRIMPVEVTRIVTVTPTATIPPIETAEE